MVEIETEPSALLLVILKLSKRASRLASEPSTLDSWYSWYLVFLTTYRQMVS